jgi:YggT family protein
MSLIVLILETIFGIVLVSTVARFLAQMSRADFYNPLAQTVIKITDPFLKPLRRVIPSMGGMDVAALVALLLGQVLFAVLIVVLNGVNPVEHLAQIVVWGVIAAASLILTVIKWSMFIVAIASFLLMGQPNPFVGFITQMIEPFVGPFRKLNLQIGMLDLSFLLAFFVIMILNDYILVQMVGSFVGYNRGLYVG